MKGMCDEDNPYDSKEKLSIEERNTSEDIVDHDSGDLQVYTQEGKHNIQEEDIVYTNVSEDVLDQRTQRSFGTTSFSPKVEKVFCSEKKQISKFNCSDCEYTTLDRQLFKHHIETNHEGIRYPCNVFNHQSRSVMNLRDHQASMHKINPRFRCKLCDFCTNHTNHKREHVRRRHPESIDQEIFEINKKRRDNCLWLEKKAEKK